MPPRARSFSNGAVATADLPRPVPGGRLMRAVAGLFPAYFAFVMATGALSIAAHLLSLPWLAWTLLATGSIAYLLLWLLTLVRVFRFPARVVADMHDHTLGPGFFTLIAATSILCTLFFWAAATWWIPLLVGLTVWRHVVARYPLDYSPQLWGMVFPLAMYTTGTSRLAEALALPFLEAIAWPFLILALTAWAGTAAAMLLHLARALKAGPVVDRDHEARPGRAAS